MAFVKPSLVSKPSRNLGCFLRLRSAIINNNRYNANVVLNYFLKESFCISVIVFATEWCRSLR